MKSSRPRGPTVMHDKPAKYPVIFRAADLVLLTKMDLAPAMEDSDSVPAEQAVRNLANAAPVLPIAARKAVNLAPWLTWLRSEIARIRQQTTAEPLDAFP
jgi:hydrogenase nickel incorporation protein HypB